MFIVLFLAVCLLNPVNVFASRVSPVKISPIVYKDVKIVAENYSPDNMGVVQAFDIKTNKLIWSKKVYEVKIKPRVEADTQFVFIKEMKIDGDKLIVVNEKEKAFTLDPYTGEDLDSSSLVIGPMIAIPIIVIILIVVVKRKLTS